MGKARRNPLDLVRERVSSADDWWFWADGSKRNVKLPEINVAIGATVNTSATYIKATSRINILFAVRSLTILSCKYARM